MIPALFSAISDKLTPKKEVCSRLIVVITERAGFAIRMLVLSVNPNHFVDFVDEWLAKDGHFIPFRAIDIE